MSMIFSAMKNNEYKEINFFPTTKVSEHQEKKILIYKKNIKKKKILIYKKHEMEIMVYLET